VLRDGGAAHRRKLSGKIASGTFVVAHEAQDRAPCAVGQRPGDVIDGFRTTDRRGFSDSSPNSLGAGPSRANASASSGYCSATLWSASALMILCYRLARRGSRLEIQQPGIGIMPVWTVWTSDSVAVEATFEPGNRPHRDEADNPSSDRRTRTDGSWIHSLGTTPHDAAVEQRVVGRVVVSAIVELP
jgi:hypothetical protein